MDTKTFWVGDRPGGSWTFQILDSRSGEPLNLNSYHTARMVIVGSDNEEVETPSINTSIADAGLGLVTFLWPDKSLFTQAGRYQMQVELIGNSARRLSTVQEILIKKTGGVTR